jgi:hypothetical protein
MLSILAAIRSNGGRFLRLIGHMLKGGYLEDGWAVARHSVGRAKGAGSPPPSKICLDCSISKSNTAAATGALTVALAGAGTRNERVHWPGTCNGSLGR